MDRWKVKCKECTSLKSEVGKLKIKLASLNKVKSDHRSDKVSLANARLELDEHRISVDKLNKLVLSLIHI